MVIFGFKEKREIKKNIKDAINKINKNIYNDDLWLGRFEMILNKIRFQRFEDWSGYTALIEITLLDKRTNLIKKEYVSYSEIFLESHLWKFMNDFIVETVKVWQEDPRPQLGQTQNFRDIKWKDIL